MRPRQSTNRPPPLAPKRHQSPERTSDRAVTQRRSPRQSRTHPPVSLGRYRVPSRIVELLLEVEAGPTIALPDSGADLVAFLSFAVSRGFGAVHPAIALAESLGERRAIAWGPLTTFYEAEIEDAEDRERLELAWQPAGRLGEACTALAAGLGDPEAEVFLRRAALPGLPAQAAAAAQALARLPQTTRVRMVYRL